MNYKEIRNIINNFSVNPKNKQMIHDSVISPLFPGTFNYCLNEVFLYEKYHSYLDIPDPVFFTKIQPAIRDSDFVEFYLKKGNGDRTHLVSFDIATISGGKIDKRENYHEFLRDSVNSTYKLLTEYLKLEPENIFVTYFGGCSVKDVGRSKFYFDFFIPEDSVSKKFFIEAGIPEKNISPIDNRDNFLMINFTIGVGPWGYRNEIFYKMPNGFLLDVATIEHLLWRPIIDHEKNQVIGLVDWENCFVIDGFGVERTLMAVNKLDYIQQCGNIFPLFSKIQEISKGDYNHTRIITECIRVVHRVFTDADTGWKSLSQSRRERIKRFMNLILDLSEENLRELFTINAELYKDFYPELEKGIDLALKEVVDYKNRLIKHGVKI